MITTTISFDTEHHGQIHDAQLDYYGKILATAASDNSIRLWDVSGEYPGFIAELLGHEGPIWRLSWSHPQFGSLLASCSYDQRIILWKEKNSSGIWEAILQSEEHTSSVNCVCFSPWEYGLHLAGASSDGTISVLSYRVDSASWSRKAFQAHANGVLTIDWSPASSISSQNVSSVRYAGTPTSSGFQKRLVSGGCDFQIRIWLYVESNDEWIFSQNLNIDKIINGWIRDVAWRPAVGGPNTIVSCSDDGNVVIWMEAESPSWKPKQVLSFDAPAWKASWSITGTNLAIAYGTQELSFYKESLSGTWEAVADTSEEVVPLPQYSHNVDEIPAVFQSTGAC